MKINRLETHDRLLEFGKQSDLISKGVTDCINSRPEEFENFPFYIFAHKREIGMDERNSLYYQDVLSSSTGHKRLFSSFSDVPTHRLIWSPRLTKPKAQTNSMLFKAYPPGDVLNVIWIIPERETWDMYEDGKITQNSLVSESIYRFQTDRTNLEAKEDDDLPDSKIDAIYKAISKRKETRRETWE